MLSSWRPLKWNAMSEDQKKETFDALPADQKKGKTYYEWITEGYHNQYENWMPWIEDKYLSWFTKDNKTSYAAKGACERTSTRNIRSECMLTFLLRYPRQIQSHWHRPSRPAPGRRQRPRQRTSRSRRTLAACRRRFLQGGHEPR